MQLALIVLLAAHTVAATSDAAPKEKVAVLNLKTPGMSEEDGKFLNDTLVPVLASEFATLGLEVISTADIEAMLTLEKQKDLLGCDDNSCLAEIGGALGSDLLLSGSLAKVDDGYSVSLVLIETRSSSARARFQDAAGSVGALPAVLKRGARALFGKKDSASGTGALLVRSEPPGAEILVDDKPVGIAPVTLDAVSVGEHTIVARLANKSGRTVVRVESDQVARVSIEMKAAAVKVRIFSEPPEAQVFIDGDLVGTSPVILDAVESGERTVRIQAEGYAPYNETISLSYEDFVAAGEEPIKIDAILKRHLRVPVSLGVGGMTAILNDFVFHDGLALTLEATVEPVRRWQLSFVYSNPTALTLATRFYILNHPVFRLGPMAGVSAFVMKPVDSWSWAPHLGASAEVKFYDGLGQLRLRLDFFFSASFELERITAPIALTLLWRF